MESKCNDSIEFVSTRLLSQVYTFDFFSRDSQFFHNTFAANEKNKRNQK